MDNKEEKSFLDYNIDEIGPSGKIITDIIIQTEDAMVYIDENETIQYETNSELEEIKGVGDVENKISFWEMMSNKLFNRSESLQFKCLLAEGYARAFVDRDSKAANEIIERTVHRIETYGREILKQKYILASFYCTVIVMIITLSMVIWKKVLLTDINENTYDIIITTLFGGIGAFIFATLRLKTYTPDIIISKNVHRIDGSLRIFYGIVSGLVIAIAIKSNIVLGFINQASTTIYLKVFLGVVAGASEILIPNLIKQVEDKTIKGNNKNNNPHNGQ